MVIWYTEWHSVFRRAQRTQRRDKVGAGEHSSLAQGVDDSREKENAPRWI